VELCGVEAEDRPVDTIGCIRLFYLKIIILVVIGPRSILVFLSFDLIYK
jgi:hypothetical protein